MPFIEHDPEAHKAPIDGDYYHPIGVPMPEGIHAILGRFLQLTVTLEFSLQTGCGQLSGLEDTVARNVFHRRNISEMRSIFRILYNLKDPKCTAEQQDNILKLATYVSSIRNIIAHQLPDWRDGWLRFNNYETARDRSKHYIYVVKITELENLNTIIPEIVDVINSMTYRSVTEETYARLMSRVEQTDLPAGPPN